MITDSKNAVFTTLRCIRIIRYFEFVNYCHVHYALLLAIAKIDNIDLSTLPDVHNNMAAGFWYGCRVGYLVVRYISVITAHVTSDEHGFGEIFIYFYVLPAFPILSGLYPVHVDC